MIQISSWTKDPALMLCQNNKYVMSFTLMYGINLHLHYQVRELIPSGGKKIYAIDLETASWEFNYKQYL